MDKYISTFGWIALGIDVLLIIVCVGCVVENGRHLMNYRKDSGKDDVDFRFLMSGMSAYFLIANYSALRRHIGTFINSNPINLTDDIVDSLITDRTGMLAVGVFMVLLTIKHRSDWFKS